MILAIDSSIGTSVALSDGDGNVLASASESGHLSHAEVIGSLIERVLGDAGSGPAEVSAVACGMGPGPFTGLRIGIAAARAFAVGRGVPVVPIMSHDAIATRALDEDPERDLVVVTDARRREVAWSRYAGRTPSGAPIRIDGPLLAVRETFAVGDADRLDAVDVPAEGIAFLAALTVRGDRDADPDEPVYLRAPDVTLSTRKRVSQ